MTKSYPKWSIIAVVVLVVGLVVGGIVMLQQTPVEETVVEEVNIMYWTGWGGTELEDLQEIIQTGFNEKRLDIEVETRTIFGAYEKLLAAIAGGVAPDVVSAVWDAQVAGLAARGALLPLDEFARESGIRGEDFWPRLWESFHYDNRLYALAATTNAQFIAFNKDMVEAAGLNPDNPPTTITELDEWARMLTKWDAEGNIEVLGYRPTGIALWGRLFGGDFYDEEARRITANDPKIVEALEWILSYNEWLDPDLVARFSAGLGGYWTPENPFFAEDIAMMNYGEWIVRFGELYNPELRYGIFAFPTPDGEANATLFGGSMFVIPKDSEHPKEAWEFLEWVSGEEATKEIGIKFANMPPRINVAKLPEVREVIPVLELTIPLMERGNAFTSYSMPIWQEYVTALGAAEEMVIHGKNTPQEALDEVTARMQEELDRFYAR